jgi:hypothetical protein
LSRSWSKDKTAPVNHHDYGQKDRIAPANRQDYSQKDKAAGAITCPYHWDLLTLHHQVTPWNRQRKSPLTDEFIIVHNAPLESTMRCDAPL